MGGHITYILEQQHCIASNASRIPQCKALHGRRKKIAGDAHLRIDNDSQKEKQAEKGEMRNDYRYLAWKGAKLSVWQVISFVTVRASLSTSPLLLPWKNEYIWHRRTASKFASVFSRARDFVPIWNQSDMAILISRSQRLTAVIGIACIFFLAEISGMHLSCPFFFFTLIC